MRVNPKGTSWLGLVETIIDLANEPDVCEVEVLLASLADGEQTSEGLPAEVRGLLIRGWSDEIRDELRKVWDTKPVFRYNVCWVERPANQEARIGWEIAHAIEDGKPVPSNIEPDSLDKQLFSMYLQDQVQTHKVKKMFGQDETRYKAILALCKEQNLCIGENFSSQAEIDKAYEYTAELLTKTIPHEAGHAIVGMTIGAGDVLQWLAVYCIRNNQPGGGCMWGHKKCEPYEKWALWSAGMAAEELRYPGQSYNEVTAQADKAELQQFGFNLANLPLQVNWCLALIKLNQLAWEKLQEAIYEKLIHDLTHRAQAIKQGQDMGVLSGDEIRKIFTENKGQCITIGKPDFKTK